MAREIRRGEKFVHSSGHRNKIIVGEVIHHYLRRYVRSGCALRLLSELLSDTRKAIIHHLIWCMKHRSVIGTATAIATIKSS